MFNKCRVYYRSDSTIAIVHPALNSRRVELTDPTTGKISNHVYEELKHVITELEEGNLEPKVESEADWLKRVYEKTEVHKKGFLFDDVDVTDLPQDRATRDKWRGSKGNGVHVDNSVVTVAEKRQLIEDDLDSELAKPNSDMKKIAVLQRKLQKREYG